MYTEIARSLSRLDKPIWAIHTYTYSSDPIFSVLGPEMDVLELLPGWTLAGWLKAHGHIDPHVPGRFRE